MTTTNKVNQLILHTAYKCCADICQQVVVLTYIYIYCRREFVNFITALVIRLITIDGYFTFTFDQQVHIDTTYRIIPTIPMSQCCIDNVIDMPMRWAMPSFHLIQHQINNGQNILSILAASYPCLCDSHSTCICV